MKDTKRFIVVSTNDPCLPEDERYESDTYRNVLFDALEKRIVGSDGGEPEDQSLGRDWRWVPEELNLLAAECARLRELVLAEQLRYGRQRAANAVWMGLAARLARNGQGELARETMERADKAAADVRIEDFVNASVR